jgi:hypothetical protein
MRVYCAFSMVAWFAVLIIGILAGLLDSTPMLTVEPIIVAGAAACGSSCQDSEGR